MVLYSLSVNKNSIINPISKINSISPNIKPTKMFYNSSNSFISFKFKIFISSSISKFFYVNDSPIIFFPFSINFCVKSFNSISEYIFLFCSLVLFYIMEIFFNTKNTLLFSCNFFFKKNNLIRFLIHFHKILFFLYY